MLLFKPSVSLRLDDLHILKALDLDEHLVVDLVLVDLVWVDLDLAWVDLDLAMADLAWVDLDLALADLAWVDLDLAWVDLEWADLELVDLVLADHA